MSYVDEMITNVDDLIFEIIERNEKIKLEFGAVEVSV